MTGRGDRAVCIGKDCLMETIAIAEPRVYTVKVKPTLPTITERMEA